MKFLDYDGLLYFWGQLKNYFVKKESGKGLSTNDYTTAEKTKLGGVATGAQVNKIESVKVNGTALTISSKAVDVTVPTKVSQLSNDSGFTKVQSSTNGKIKIDGTDTTVYTHPTTTATNASFVKVGKDANGHVVLGSAIAKSDITALGIPASDTTYSTMTGATSDANGTSGLVPAPTSGKQSSFLRGDGTWVVPTNTTYANATTSKAGLMSTNDKSKLDGIASNANNYVLPDATTTEKGGVTVGSNISLNGSTISLTKANVTSALGYTPPTTNTTYSVATQSANGLLSASDKKKIDNLATTISTAIAGAGHLKRSVVEALPTTSIDANTIYMILANDDSADNKYVEWMYINSKWEKVGDSDVDLSGYAKTSDLVKISNAEIDTVTAS